MCSVFFALQVTPATYVKAEKKEEGLNLTCASYVLMEGSTGRVLCEKNKDKELMPASITKIMTLLLIFEELDKGKIKMEDTVTVSEYAASMGGSQVYLESGETQTVEDMIKCITIASANDACVAMSEYISGTEEEFVKRMNQRAKELGMEHTNFMNCCGLDDSLTEGQHYSTAYDIALMSRELIVNHKEIQKFTTTWMDEITHVTRKGESVFGLTNTNKLVRTYDGITGLKTGSTSKAKYCLSATANRNGMDLIAVVMAAPMPLTRFVEAGKLLDYGFANCAVYQDDNKELAGQSVAVKKGTKDKVRAEAEKPFSYIFTNGENHDKIEKNVTWNESLEAPVKKGDKIGEITYRYGEEELGKVNLLAGEEVKKAKYGDYLKKVLGEYFVITE